jgi:hypothetical protein
MKLPKKSPRFRLWVMSFVLVLIAMAPITLFVFKLAAPSNKFSKIELGMTQRQVESIFGRPADADNVWEAVQQLGFKVATPMAHQGEGIESIFDERRTLRCWGFPEHQGVAICVFDGSEKLVGKIWCESDERKRSILEIIRSWFGF